MNCSQPYLTGPIADKVVELSASPLVLHPISGADLHTSVHSGRSRLTLTH